MSRPGLRRAAASLGPAVLLILAFTPMGPWPALAQPQDLCASPTALRPLEPAQIAAASATPSAAAPPPPAAAPPPAADGGDYRHLLRPTPLGWPIVSHWCVWIEPLDAAAAPGEARRQRDWLMAVDAALQQWNGLLSLSRVSATQQAHVRLWRRRPPLQRLADGRLRASDGRATLALVAVQHPSGWRAEPRIDVLLSPGRAPLPLQATALHELGHAFGIWAHSDDPADAMAVSPGPRPVLQLSRRDRATMIWLQQQVDRLPRNIASCCSP